MTVELLGELLVGSTPLSLWAFVPVVRAAPRPALPIVVPELVEDLLEEVGGVERLVARQQLSEILATLLDEVLLSQGERAILPLDEGAVFAGTSSVLGLMLLVGRLAQVTHELEFVEEDRRHRRMLGGSVARGPTQQVQPHVVHLATTQAEQAPGLELQNVRHVSARQIAVATHPLSYQPDCTRLRSRQAYVLSAAST